MSPTDVAGAVVETAEVRLRLDVSRSARAGLLTALTVEVNQACDRAEDAPDGPPVVVELAGTEPGDGPAGGWPAELAIAEVNRWERAVRRLERLGAPIVAVAGGLCAGPALDVLLAADHRIGTPGTRLALAREGDLLWPGMALHRLVQQVGLARVRPLALLGRSLTAREAAELGLLDQVTEDTGAAVSSVTAELSGLSGRALAVQRRLLLEAVTTSHEEAIGVHLAACDRTLRRTHEAGPAEENR
ncbi:enoyl-CoA-hydratase DpgB [Streptomyces sp. NPDC049687]|uniref:enoyl-CoA-hydratase DpgB n=1 Tax=Streptomyces sp. NPDC049687 TaxID=3365596 RepID=UPI0037A4E9A6